MSFRDVDYFSIKNEETGKTVSSFFCSWKLMEDEIDSIMVEDTDPSHVSIHYEMDDGREFDGSAKEFLEE